MDRLTQLQNLVHNLEELFSISTSAAFVGPANQPSLACAHGGLILFLSVFWLRQ